MLAQQCDRARAAGRRSLFAPLLIAGPPLAKPFPRNPRDQNRSGSCGYARLRRGEIQVAIYRLSALDVISDINTAIDSDEGLGTADKIRSTWSDPPHNSTTLALHNDRPIA